MILKDYKDNVITWQAHAVMQVEQRCIDSGTNPNGKKLTNADIKESQEQINNCMQILIANGCIDTQFKLSFL